MLLLGKQRVVNTSNGKYIKQSCKKKEEEEGEEGEGEGEEECY